MTEGKKPSGENETESGTEKSAIALVTGTSGSDAGSVLTRKKGTKAIDTRKVAPEIWGLRDRILVAFDAAQRRDPKLTQNDIARWAGLSQGTMSRILTSTKPQLNLPLNTVLLLSHVLRCEFLWLATGRGPDGL